jgi:hypothetical protein
MYSKCTCTSGAIEKGVIVVSKGADSQRVNNLDDATVVVGVPMADDCSVERDASALNGLFNHSFFANGAINQQGSLRLPVDG